MTGSKTRLFRVLRILGLLLVLGLGYALILRWMGRGLRCPFHTLTGLLCPGCGVSRMCLALLAGDWAGAWRANPALLLLTPVIAVLLGLRTVRYVRGGPAKAPAWENRVWIGAAVLLAAFGVLRNLPGMTMLTPG